MIRSREHRTYCRQLKAANVVDSGGMGLLIILKGMYEALQSGFQMAEKLEEKSFEEYVAARDTHTEITFGYCTEFIVLAAPDNGEFQRVSGGPWVIPLSM